MATSFTYKAAYDVYGAALSGTITPGGTIGTPGILLLTTTGMAQSIRSIATVTGSLPVEAALVKDTTGAAISSPVYADCTYDSASQKWICDTAAPVGTYAAGAQLMRLKGSNPAVTAGSAAATVTSTGTVTKLATPVVGQPTNITSGGFKISWAAVTGADSYRVRLNNATLFMPGNVTTYTFTGLPANTQATADVQALDSTNAKQASNYSNVVTATTTATPQLINYVPIGDSLTYGAQVGGPGSGKTYSEVAVTTLNQAAGFQRISIAENMGIPGRDASFFLTDTSTYNGITPLQHAINLVQPGKINVATLKFGANGLAYGNTPNDPAQAYTPAQELSFVKQVYTQLKAGGYDLVGLDFVMNRTGYPEFATYNGNARLPYNRLQLAEATFTDGRIDLPSYPLVYGYNAPNNITYFAAGPTSSGTDGSHLSATGHAETAKPYAQWFARHISGFFLAGGSGAEPTTAEDSTQPVVAARQLTWTIPSHLQYVEQQPDRTVLAPTTLANGTANPAAPNNFDKVGIADLYLSATSTTDDYFEFIMPDRVTDGNGNLVDNDAPVNVGFGDTLVTFNGSPTGIVPINRVNFYFEGSIARLFKVPSGQTNPAATKIGQDFARPAPGSIVRVQKKVDGFYVTTRANAGDTPIPVPNNPSNDPSLREAGYVADSPQGIPLYVFTVLGKLNVSRCPAITLYGSVIGNTPA